LAITKKTVGDGGKLLTYLNSALKALLGFDIFPCVPKKSEILLPSVINLLISLHETSCRQHASRDHQPIVHGKYQYGDCMTCAGATLVACSPGS